MTNSTSTSALDDFEAGKVSAFLTSFVLHGSTAFAAFIAFSYLRRRWPNIFEARYLSYGRAGEPLTAAARMAQCDRRSIAPELLRAPPKSVFGLIKHVIRYPLAEMVSVVGTDAVMLLLAVKMGIVFFAALSFLGVVMLLPINFKADSFLPEEAAAVAAAAAAAGNTTSTTWSTFRFEDVSIAHLANGSPALWAHCVSVYAFTFILLRQVVRTYKQYVPLRFAWLALAPEARPARRTLLVTGLPSSVTDDASFYALFNRLFPDQIQSACLVTPGERLDNAVEKRRELVLKVLRVRVDYERAILKAYRRYREQRVEEAAGRLSALLRLRRWVRHAAAQAGASCARSCARCTGKPFTSPAPAAAAGAGFQPPPRPKMIKGKPSAWRWVLGWWAPWQWGLRVDAISTLEEEIKEADAAIRNMRLFGYSDGPFHHKNKFIGLINEKVTALERVGRVIGRTVGPAGEGIWSRITKPGHPDRITNAMTLAVRAFQRGRGLVATPARPVSTRAKPVPPPPPPPAPPAAAPSSSAQVPAGEEEGSEELDPRALPLHGRKKQAAQGGLIARAAELAEAQAEAAAAAEVAAAAAAAAASAPAPPPASVPSASSTAAAQAPSAKIGSTAAKGSSRALAAMRQGFPSVTGPSRRQRLAAQGSSGGAAAASGASAAGSPAATPGAITISVGGATAADASGSSGAPAAAGTSDGAAAGSSDGGHASPTAGSATPPVPEVKPEDEPRVSLRSRLSRLGVYKPERAGFVTFKTLALAQITPQTALTSVGTGLSNMLVRTAPDPQEIIWSNVGLEALAKAARYRTSLLIAITFTLAYTFLLGSITSLTTPDSISKIPGFQSLGSSSSALLRSFVEGFVSTVLIKGFVSLVPDILGRLAKYGGARSRSEQAFTVFRYAFIFMLWNVFLVVSISGSVWDGLWSIVKSPATIVDVLARSLPSRTSYFMSYLMLGMTSKPVSLLSSTVRYTLFAWIKQRGVRTPNEIRELRERLAGPLDYASEYTDFLVTFCIAIGFSSINPLICVVATGNLCVHLWTLKYQLLYMRFRSYERGGQLFTLVAPRLLVGAIIYQLLMVGLLGAKGAPGPSVAIIPCIVITISFALYLHAYYRRVSEFLSVDTASRPLSTLAYALRPTQRALVMDPLRREAYSMLRVVAAVEMLRAAMRRWKARRLQTGDPAAWSLGLREAYGTAAGRAHTMDEEAEAALPPEVRWKITLIRNAEDTGYVRPCFSRDYDMVYAPAASSSAVAASDAASLL